MADKICSLGVMCSCFLCRDPAFLIDDGEICIADTRDDCISRMSRALDELIIEGITTNIDF